MSNRTLKISVVCRSCGKSHNLMVDPVDRRDWENKVGSKRFVQNAFPYLDSAERELLVSQTCGACWDKMFPPEDEEETP